MHFQHRMLLEEAVRPTKIHRCQDIISTHAINTSYQHILSTPHLSIHPINTQTQTYILCSYVINASYMRTSSTHSIYTPNSHTPSTFPLNLPSQPMPSTFSIFSAQTKQSAERSLLSTASYASYSLR